MARVASVKSLQNNVAISHACCEEREVSTKNSSAGMMVGNAISKTNLFLSDVYAKLEEAQQDLLDGKCSPVEDAVSRIRQRHGL